MHITNTHQNNLGAALHSNHHENQKVSLETSLFVLDEVSWNFALI